MVSHWPLKYCSSSRSNLWRSFFLHMTFTKEKSYSHKAFLIGAKIGWLRSRAESPNTTDVAGKTEQGVFIAEFPSLNAEIFFSFLFKIHCSSKRFRAVACCLKPSATFVPNFCTVAKRTESASRSFIQLVRRTNLSDSSLVQHANSVTAKNRLNAVGHCESCRVREFAGENLLDPSFRLLVNRCGCLVQDHDACSSHESAG